MQITHLSHSQPLSSGQAAFRLQAECDADVQFLDALDILRPQSIVSLIPTRTASATSGQGGKLNTAAQLRFDTKDPALLVRNAAHQAARSLFDLFSLLARQHAPNVHIGDLATTNPQPQVSPAALLVQLQNVLHAHGVGIGQPEAVIEKVIGTHESAPVEVDPNPASSTPAR